MQMEKINLEKNIPENGKIDLYMALGKANEDLKNYEKSFNFYLLGNTLKRKIVKYNINDDLKLFEQIKETFNKKLFDQVSFSENNDIAPIFIVGMPRSGTSLVEQILATHPKVHGAGELTELGKQINKIFLINKKFIFPKEPKDWNSKNLEIISQEYIKYLKKISNKHKYITDKLPHNFQWIGFIKILFPKSKIIHCTRNKYDNCLSIFKNFFAGNLKFCYDLKELAQHYKGYLDLMEHWQREIPGYIYNISYEKLSDNRKINYIDFEEFKPILEKLGFDLERKPVKQELRESITYGIKEGNRNNSLFKLSCHLLSSGIDSNIAYNQIQLINQKSPKPLDNQEVEQLFESASSRISQENSESNQKFKISDRIEYQLVDETPKELKAITLDDDKTRLILVYLPTKITENGIETFDSKAYVVSNGIRGKQIQPLDDPQLQKQFIINQFSKFRILDNKWKNNDVQKYLQSNDKVDPKEIFDYLLKIERKYFEYEYDYDNYFELCWITHTYFYTLFDITPYNDYSGMKNVVTGKTNGQYMTQKYIGAIKAV